MFPQAFHHHLLFTHHFVHDQAGFPLAHLHVDHHRLAAALGLYPERFGKFQSGIFPNWVVSHSRLRENWWLSVSRKAKN